MRYRVRFMAEASSHELRGRRARSEAHTVPPDPGDVGVCPVCGDGLVLPTRA
jgi:hypothetical protein